MIKRSELFDRKFQTRYMRFLSIAVVTGLVDQVLVGNGARPQTVSR